MKRSQLKLFPLESKSYGGILMKTRKGRASGRPLATRNSMHLVMRSSQAIGPMSFRRPQNARQVKLIIQKFAHKYAIKIHSLANVGNHLHLHLQLGHRATYKPFIRAITAAIAMAITGVSRWSRGHGLAKDNRKGKLRFWDYRPFTRIVTGFRDFKGVRDYIRINQLEGLGYSRDVAKIVHRFTLASGNTG